MSRRRTATTAGATELLRLRAAAGGELGERRDLPPRVRRALDVARQAGAPMSDALDGASAAEADARQAVRAVAVASAQTRAVAGGLLLAPLVLTPALGRLVGADLLAFYTSPIGLAVAGVAGVLYGLGAGLVLGMIRRIGRSAAGVRRLRMVPALAAGALVWWALHPALAPVVAVLVARSGSRASVDVGVDEAADLTATALAGGVSVPLALRTAAGHLPPLADRLHRLAFDLELTPHAVRPDLPPSEEPFARFAQVLRAAVVLGAPVAPSLRRLARDLRADDLARILAATERLPAQLTFPTALCLLPATLLTVGAPIVSTGLSSVGT